MLDRSIAPQERQLRKIKNPSTRVVELCKDYFEIAIGYRQPTEKEKQEASKCMLQAGLLGEDQTLENRVKALKYPLQTTQNGLIRQIYQLEYDVFEFLSQETNLIDGPFLPMLRYELRMQSEIRDRDELDTGILRQSALIETLIKMKMNQWKDSNGNFLLWELCIASAYRGENLIIERELDKLCKLSTVRNRLAHDWRDLGMRSKSEIREIKDAFENGIEVLSGLYGRELQRVYEGYSGNHISNMLPVRWSDRQKAELTVGTARTTVQISCDQCGYEFYPHRDGWKRCPECDSPHDWLENMNKE